MQRHTQKSQHHYAIDLSIICPNGHSEIILDNRITAECQLEDILAQRLTTFFDTVQVDEVSIQRGTGPNAPITITLRAQGFEPLIRTPHLDLVIEEKLTCALSEFFDSLHVERCAVH
ncbi:MAG TPA: hypothetical protein VHD63_20490 [Ktedonobacteraceae bacterium]|nr:hypothetical protein [Ktedonobacteraceae bacterium]